MATDAVRRGVSERAPQTCLDHSNAPSARRYARMSDEASVSVLRPRAESRDEDLSVARRWPASLDRNTAKQQEKVASLTHSSWNQPLEWLLEVEKLRRSLGEGPEAPLPAP